MNVLINPKNKSTIPRTKKTVGLLISILAISNRTPTDTDFLQLFLNSFVTNFSDTTNLFPTRDFCTVQHCRRSKVMLLVLKTIMLMDSLGEMFNK